MKNTESFRNRVKSNHLLSGITIEKLSERSDNSYDGYDRNPSTISISVRKIKEKDEFKLP